MNLEIANRLVELRKEKGYSQEELAERLGVSRQAVSKWERGESSPDTDNLIELAKLYNISLDDLLLLNKENIEVREVETEIVDEDEKIEGNTANKIRKIAYSITPLVICFIYILMGALWGLWHPGWIIFLLIPVIQSVFDCIANKNIHQFLFPVFITAIYLFLGCEYNLWHPWWILYLLIPIFYSVVD